MASPTVASIVSDLEALTARVAALEAKVSGYDQRITDLDTSDAASGWKAWREAKVKPSK